MLKRIESSEVELGMFIHKMEGSWFSHPFWRAKFLVSDEEQLAKLRDSELDGVVIDTSKGSDLGGRANAIQQQSIPLPLRERSAPPRAPLAGTRRAVSAPNTGAAGKPFDLSSTAPQTTAREFGNATRVAGRAQKAVSKVFLEARLGKAIKASAVEPVIEDIFASVQRNPHAFNGLMRCKRDNEYLYRHALAVSALMITLGRQIKLSVQDLQLAGMAGLLIDVGIGHLPVDLAEYGGDYRLIPDAIMESHVALGHNSLIAGGMPAVVVRACLEHHERLDGSGYPQGLAGDAISHFARMVAICDTYDYLVNDADGALGLNPVEALQKIETMPGLDGDLLASFTEAMGIYPIGSVVLLRSGRLAMVIDQCPSDVSRPRVRPFYSVKLGRMVASSEVDLANCQGEDAIEGPASPNDHNISHFPELRSKLFATISG